MHDDPHDEYAAAEESHLRSLTVAEADGDERAVEAALRPRTLDEVARIITAERPDIILLQEVDDGASRTDGEDQLARLLGKLDSKLGYVCHASAWYWKASFVPHGKIMGAVGMKLSTISRYRITDATRYQLPIMPAGFIREQLGLKRAVLQVDMPVEKRPSLAVLNTHLDAFAQGTDTMAKQVARVKEIVSAIEAEKRVWLMGGDFNLLASRPARARLAADQRTSYAAETELQPLTDAYPSVPSVTHTLGAAAPSWFTHFPNDPSVKAPDRTIDYVFFSKALTLGDHSVRRRDTLAISDHLPVIVTVTLP